MTVYQIVFSPTGGTKKVSEILTNAWLEASAGVEAAKEKICFIDLSAAPDQWEAERTKAAITSEDVCVIAVPSFKGRVPEPAVSRLKELKGSEAHAVEVVVYGNRLQEDTLIELQDTVKEAGFRPMAAVTAVAEHSMVRTVAAGRPDTEDAKVLCAYAEKIAAKLSCEDESVRNSEPVIPGNRPYKPYPQEPCTICTEDTCIACGTCASLCPTGAIPVDAPQKTREDLCIGCMRCVSLCPIGARGMTETKRVFITGLLEKFASDRKENKLFL